ncbi:MAG: A/G-specific adenine glycosylase [Planctomycetota bacterium]
MPRKGKRILEISLKQRSSIRRRLLHWYDRNKRDLPWRRTNDPYAIWVSEIMLQQTRVETVLDYYDRFLKRFPTVGALAKAKDQDVLQIWQGLGYYRRAFHLRDAARELRCHNGTLPSTAEELRRLPGVGAYTSAAVASIAFGQPEAAVDGNVSRVLSRLLGIYVDLASSAGRNEIQHHAQILLSPQRPGDFNQAWMDLGSGICTPKSPQCPNCPLKSQCRAFQDGSVNRSPLPSRGTKRMLPIVNMVVGVFRQNRRFLVQRRPPKGLWSGLWEFPNQPGRNGPNGDDPHSLIDRLGLHPGETPAYLGRIQHVLTHRVYRFDIFTCDVIGRTTADEQTPRKWVDLKKLADIPMSRAQRKISELMDPQPTPTQIVSKTA